MKDLRPVITVAKGDRLKSHMTLSQRVLRGAICGFRVGVEQAKDPV